MAPTLISVVSCRIDRTCFNKYSKGTGLDWTGLSSSLGMWHGFLAPRFVTVSFFIFSLHLASFFKIRSQSEVSRLLFVSVFLHTSLFLRFGVCSAAYRTLSLSSSAATEMLISVGIGLSGWQNGVWSGVWWNYCEGRNLSSGIVGCITGSSSSYWNPLTALPSVAALFQPSEKSFLWCCA